MRANHGKADSGSGAPSCWLLPWGPLLPLAWPWRGSTWLPPRWNDSTTV